MGQHMTPSRSKSLKSCEKQGEQSKDEQIIYFVNQCFACQNTYGKTASQLKIMTHLLVVDLRKYDINLIDRAFNEWRKTSEIIPSNAGILSLIEGYLRHSRDMYKPNKTIQKTCNKKYGNISKEGQLLFDKAMAQAKINLTKGVVLENNHQDGVPWYGLGYSKLIKLGFGGKLEKHLQLLASSHKKNRADGYLKYLKSLDRPLKLNL